MDSPKRCAATLLSVIPVLLISTSRDHRSVNQAVRLSWRPHVSVQVPVEQTNLGFEENTMLKAMRKGTDSECLISGAFEAYHQKEEPKK